MDGEGGISHRCVVIDRRREKACHLAISSAIVKPVEKRQAELGPVAVEWLKHGDTVALIERDVPK